MKIKFALKNLGIGLLLSTHFFLENTTAQTIVVGSSELVNLDNDNGIMRSNTSGATWNRHAYLYPRSVLTTLPTVASLTAFEFNRSVADAANLPGNIAGAALKIYVINTASTNTDLGAADLDWAANTASATLVFNGDPSVIVGSTSGFKLFNFSENFNYTGGGLVVFVEYSQPNAATGDILWTYNSSSGVPDYVANSTKYAFGSGILPTNLLQNNNLRHPNLLIRYNSTPCSGAPIITATPSDQNVCFGSTATVNFMGVTQGIGITFQWQESLNGGGTWADISQANSTILTTSTLLSSRNYRLVATCNSAGGSSVSSNGIAVNVGTILTIPFRESFNTSSTTSNCWDITTVANIGTAAMPNVSRVAVGTSPNAAPAEGDRMARFNSYACDAGDKMRLLMPPLSSVGVSSVDVTFKMYEDNEGGIIKDDKMTLQYSLDGNNWTSVAPNFRPNSSFQPYTNTGKWFDRQFTLPVTAANQANLYVGFLFESAYGSDVYIDDVKITETKAVQPSGDCNDVVILNNVSGKNWFRITAPDGKTVAEINPNGNNLGNLTAKLYVHGGAVRLAGGVPYLNRNIELTPQYQPVSEAVDVRVYYSDAEMAALRVVSASTNVNNLGVTRSDGLQANCSNALALGVNTAYVNQSANGVYPNAHYVQFAVNNFSQFFFHGGTTALLAVELLDFSGKNERDFNALKWATASEKNAQSFTIERSKDGKNDWQAVGSVKAKGNSNAVQNYQFLDKSNFNLTYYRLKINDLDGNYTYSNVVALERNGLKNLGKLTVFPNPAKEQITVEYTSENEGNLTIIVTDVAGKIMAENKVEMTEGINQIPLSINGFLNGFYFISIKNNDKNAVARFVKN